jgi:hypothetical protein
MGEVIDENDLAQAHPLWPPHQARLTGPARTISGRSEGAAQVDTGEALTITTGFLWMCQGYYRHDRRLHARMGGHGQLQGQDRPSADLA